MNRSCTGRRATSVSLLFFFLFFSSGILAQGFQLILDPVNPFQKGSLFQLTVLNPSNYSGQVLLKASLKSRRGKVLMVQESRQELNAGASKNIRGENTLYQTSYTDTEFGRLYQQANQLPPLNYILCVEAIAVGDQALKSEDCIEYRAEDFINVTVVYPPNEGEIGELRPLFSWLNLNQTPYTYDFRLVKLAEGQNSNLALRRNNPLIAIDGMNANQLPYPSDALPLENGGEYAWQLGINYNGERITQTNAQRFSYKERRDHVEIPRNLSYVDITELDPGASLYAVGVFKFKYPSTKAGKLSCKLFELKESEKKQLDLAHADFEVEAGVNKYELDLKEQIYLKHLKDYLLLIKDRETGNSYQLLLKYVNPEYTN